MVALTRRSESRPSVSSPSARAGTAGAGAPIECGPKSWRWPAKSQSDVDGLLEVLVRVSRMPSSNSLLYWRETKARKGEGEYVRLSEEVERRESGDNHGHSLP